jgi:uncharacterized protein YndB with AHSA1/START domain
LPIDPASGLIHWRIHLKSEPERVYWFLSTSEGRSRFWAESAIEQSGVVDFRFSNGATWSGRILERREPERFVLEYSGTTVSFTLTPDTDGGTDLLLTDEGAMSSDRYEVLAGWVSVLLTLKAAADFDIDLRNHSQSRSWDYGYADN